MKIRQQAITLILVASVCGLAACSSKPTEPDAVDPDGGASYEEGQDGLSTRGAGAAYDGPDARALEQESQDATLRATRIFYFEFDSSDLPAQYDPILDAHARYLVKNPAARIKLEGHTDERGTREYNIGLGERRALAVRRALLLRGATRSQLLVVSFGEEQPAALGATEAAWKQNRRVELVYP